MIAPHTTVPEELRRFFGSMLLGIPAGLLFDLLRTLRAFLPHPSPVVFLEDALYAFLLCFLLQCYAWTWADGILRLQYACGGLIGLSVYLLTVGTLWARLLAAVRHVLYLIRQKTARAFVKNTEKVQND